MPLSRPKENRCTSHAVAMTVSSSGGRTILHKLGTPDRSPRRWSGSESQLGGLIRYLESGGEVGAVIGGLSYGLDRLRSRK